MRKKKTSSEYDLQLFEKEIDVIRIAEYITARTPILHECIEGHQWKVSPDSILSKGRRCPICAGNKKKTPIQYEQELKSKNIKYTPKENYINWCSPISHECDKCLHIWKAIPNNILRGQGCPNCAIYGFNPEKPAVLYYIKIGEYYKIGITNRTIEERFKKDYDKPIIIIRVVWYSKGKYARQLEQRLLKANNRVTVPNYLKSGGNTELFVNPINWLDE